MLQRRVTVFTDEGPHDWRSAWTILPVKFPKGVRSDHPLFPQPFELSLDQQSPVMEYVRRPFKTAFLQPLLNDRYSWCSAFAVL